MPTTAYGRMLLQSRNEPTTPEATNLTEKLEQVRHVHLNLSADHLGSHRPDISIWPSTDEDLPPAIVMMQIGGSWGQQMRYAEFTPDEARTLAKYLTDAADTVDREVEAWISRKVVELAP